MADDGELLMRTPLNMIGYRNKPEATAEMLDDDGWLHTGDTGSVDEDGYVRILDRKKELIITAAGKNISPVQVEAAIKTSTPEIAQIVAIGDGRPYLVALVTLDPERAPALAATHGVELAQLRDHPEVIAAVQAGIDAANAKLARTEQIERFRIVAGDWLPDSEELTPTMKLKRKPITAKYETVIEELYAAS